MPQNDLASGRSHGSLLESASAVAKRLQNAGYVAYFAGGAVRDKILGIPHKEIDIATSATPDEIEKIFEKTVAVGKAFGVVRVLFEGAEFEVATFRRDLAYKDGRHPESVEFTSPEEDAKRRDFTINGLFYDPAKDDIIDYVGGREDIKRKIVRAIGSPRERFREDALRLIRAVRFSAKFGYKIEEKTFSAICELAPTMKRISAERIRDELLKILTGPNSAEALKILDKTGLLAEILPDIFAMKGVPQPPEFHPEGDVFVHTLLMFEFFEKSRRVRSEKNRATLALATLLHDVGKPPTFEHPPGERIRFDRHTEVGAEMGEEILKKLRLPTRQTKTIVAIIRDHLKFINIFEMRPSTLKRFLREPHIVLLLELHRIDCLASHGNLDAYHYAVKKRKEFKKEKTLKPPRLITGDDLIQMGFSPSPLFKEILSAVETEQLEGRISSAEEAQKFVREKFKK